MIDFNKELENYKELLTIDDVEGNISGDELTDIKELIIRLAEEK